MNFYFPAFPSSLKVVPNGRAAFMKGVNFIIFFCFLANALPAQPPSSGKLSIHFNYNAELLGLAYFIAFEGVEIEKQTLEINGRTIPKKEWHKYGFYIYEKYKQYATSENLAKSFEVADHLWLDYILHLLIQLDTFPNARLTPAVDARYFIRFSKKNDTIEARENATTFLNGLNRFFKEINFERYISDTRAFYDAALRQVKVNLPNTNFIRAMETFYRKEFDSYTLVPSLTIPKGMGFGLHVTKSGKTKLLNVFGAFEEQVIQQGNDLDLGFANQSRLQELSVHEFGHSFVNPVIDSLPQERVAASDGLFEPIKSTMQQQGYNTWKACLYEHFVRAGEVMIAGLLGDTAGSQKLRHHYINDRKFIFLPLILSELENYRKTKAPYYLTVLNSIDKMINQK